jgi:hypothetical protein
LFISFQQSGALDLQSALNVITSVPLIVAGALGLQKALQRRDESFTPAGLPYLGLACSLILAGAGSIWYHLFPSPANLFWDRLPIAMALASLVCAVANVFPGALWGTRVLGPAVTIASASVMFWNWTRIQGREELAPYVIVQIVAALWVGYVALLKWPHTATARSLRFALLAYAAGRVLEGMQGALYRNLGFDYAHPLKHLLIAAACFLIVPALANALPSDEAAIATMEAD